MGGDPRDRRRPSAGLAAIILALDELGHAYGCEIAKISGQSQGNTTSVWLPKLERFRLVCLAEVRPGVGHQGGGRPAMWWRLTKAGRDLASALRAEGISTEDVGTGAR